MIRVQLLGSVRVFDEAGETVPVGGARLRTVLSVLAVARPTGVSKAQLIDDIWDGGGSRTIDNALRTYVSRLRTRLSVDGVDRIRHDGGNYSFAWAEGDLVDVLSFDELIAEGRRRLRERRLRDAATSLSRARQLWVGPPFAGLDSGLLDAERSRLDVERLELLDSLGAVLVELGDHSAALDVLDPHVRENPGRESAVALLMRALYAAGRQADALDRLRDCRAWLREELGLFPGPALQEIEQGILNQTLDVAGSVPSIDVRPAVADGSSRESTGAQFPFLGRATEIDAIDSLLEAASSGAHGGSVVILGAAGIGKSRLLDEVRRRSSDRDVTVLAASCERVASRPMSALADLIDFPDREWSARSRAIVEEAANDSTKEPAATISTVVDAFDAVIRRLLESGPVLIALDDAHRADHVTLLVIEHLIRRRQAGLVVVITARPTDSIGRGDLAARWSELGADTIELGGLTRADVARLPAAAAVEHDLDHIMNLTAGSPLLLAAVLDDGRPGEPWPPFGSEDLLGVAVSRTLDGVSGEDRAVLDAGALLLGPVSPEHVAAAVGRSARDAEQSLRRCAATGVLIERDGRFEFIHDLVRDRLRAGVDVDESRRLHAAFGRTFETLPRRWVHRAYHLCLAVPVVDAVTAANESLLAAEIAIREIDYSSADEIADRALSLLAGSEAPEAPRLSAELLATRAVALEHLGRRHLALESLTAGVNLALEAGLADVAIQVALRGHNWGRSLSADDPVADLLKRAMQGAHAVSARLRQRVTTAYVYQRAASRGPDSDLADLLDGVDDGDSTPELVMAKVGMLAGQPGAAQRLRYGRQLVALSFATAAQPNSTWLRGSLIASAAALELGRSDAGIETLNRVLDAARASGYPNYTMLAMNALAGAHQQVGEFETADRLAAEALEYGTRFEVDDAFVSYSGFQYVAHYLRDEVASLLPILEDMADGESRANTAWIAGLGLAYAQAGQTDRAERLGEEVVDQLALLPPTVMYPITVAVAAELVASIGDPRLAIEVERCAAPYTGTLPRMAQVGGTFGPIDRQRALLARVLGRADESRQLFESAAQLCRDARAEPWLARIERDRAAIPS